MLNSSDEEVRLQGLKGLADLGMNDSLPQLYAALGDESWRVRKEAVEIFLSLPAAGHLTGEVTELLHAQDNAGLRNAAVEILTRLGREAVPNLLEELTCSDHDVRKFALDILGEVGDPSTVDAMVRALDDEDDNVRAAAAENLGKMQAAEAIPALVEALENSDLLMRFTILEALGRIGGPVPVTRLLPLGEERLVRKALFDCLGRVGGAEAAPVLVEGLTDAMSNVREAAALALARLAADGNEGLNEAIAARAGESHAEALVGMLDSAGLEIRRAAVGLLGKCGGPRQIARLLELFEDDQLREAALRALGDVGRETACTLIDLWPTVNSRRRVYLAYIIGEAKCTEGRSLLVEALDDPEPNLRLMAARALGALGGAGSLAPLLGRLRDPEEGVREAAVEALGRLVQDDPDRALAAVGPLLEDTEADIRVAAVTLLGRLEAPGVGSLLSFALKDESPLVRRAAVRSLEELPGSDQVSSLMLALTDEDADVRRLAAEALGASGEPAAVDALALAQRDEDFWVRTAAVRALGRLGGQPALRLVEAALDDPVGLVGIAALETLAEIAPQSHEMHARRALGHPDEEVVNAAIKLLVGSGCREWMDDFAAELINHAHWEVRVSFARALAALPTDRTRRLLEDRLLIEGEDLVRQELQDLLGQLDGQG
jgi:HEAT repeat protein